MFNCVIKMPLLLVTKKETNYLICRVNIVRETFIFNAYFYVCFSFLCEVKFCSGYFRQVFFHLGDKKIGRWSRKTGGCLIQ